MLFLVVPPFELVDEILICDHQNKSCWRVSPCDAFYYNSSNFFSSVDKIRVILHTSVYQVVGILSEVVVLYLGYVVVVVLCYLVFAAKTWNPWMLTRKSKELIVNPFRSQSPLWRHWGDDNLPKLKFGICLEFFSSMSFFIISCR